MVYCCLLNMFSQFAILIHVISNENIMVLFLHICGKCQLAAGCTVIYGEAKHGTWHFINSISHTKYVYIKNMYLLLTVYMQFTDIIVMGFFLLGNQLLILRPYIKNLGMKVENLINVVKYSKDVVSKLPWLYDIHDSLTVLFSICFIKDIFYVYQQSYKGEFLVSRYFFLCIKQTGFTENNAYSRHFAAQ